MKLFKRRSEIPEDSRRDTFVSASQQSSFRQTSGQESDYDSQFRSKALTYFTTAAALTGLYVLGSCFAPSFGTASTTYSIGSNGTVQAATSVAYSGLSSCFSAASSVIKWGTASGIVGSLACGVGFRVAQYQDDKEWEEKQRLSRTPMGRLKRSVGATKKGLGWLFSSRKSRSGTTAGDDTDLGTGLEGISSSGGGGGSGDWSF